MESEGQVPPLAPSTSTPGCSVRTLDGKAKGVLDFSFKFGELVTYTSRYAAPLPIGEVVGAYHQHPPPAPDYGPYGGYPLASGYGGYLAFVPVAPYGSYPSYTALATPVQQPQNNSFILGLLAAGFEVVAVGVVKGTIYNNLFGDGNGFN